MAGIALRSSQFAVGETVTAYPVSNWPQSQLPPSGAAVGSSAGSATVDAAGLLLITGLTDDTDYFLRGGTSGNYLRARATHTVGVDPGGVDDTKHVSGTQTSPTANTVIATLSTGLIIGAVYRVKIKITLTGTAETALRNVQLLNGGVAVMTLRALTAAGDLVTELDRVTYGGTALAVRAGANAVAGAIYNAEITATRVE